MAVANLDPNMVTRALLTITFVQHVFLYTKTLSWHITRFVLTKKNILFNILVYNYRISYGTLKNVESI